MILCIYVVFWQAKYTCKICQKITLSDAEMWKKCRTTRRETLWLVSNSGQSSSSVTSEGLTEMTAPGTPFAVERRTWRILSPPPPPPPVPGLLKPWPAPISTAINASGEFSPSKHSHCHRWRLSALKKKTNKLTNTLSNSIKALVCEEILTVQTAAWIIASRVPSGVSKLPEMTSALIVVYRNKKISEQQNQDIWDMASSTKKYWRDRHQTYT